MSTFYLRSFQARFGTPDDDAILTACNLDAILCETVSLVGMNVTQVIFSFAYYHKYYTRGV